MYRGGAQRYGRRPHPAGVLYMPSVEPQLTGSRAEKAERALYPSDQMGFPYGVGICALRRGKLGWYLSRIHTRRDTVLENTNVNILRAAITSGICCEAAK